MNALSPIGNGFYVPFYKMLRSFSEKFFLRYDKISGIVVKGQRSFYSLILCLVNHIVPPYVEWKPSL